METFLEKIKSYEVVSFDIFDTLFVRPLSNPDDLFFLIEEKTGLDGFKKLRKEAQIRAFDQMNREGRHEISLDDIYNNFVDLPIDPQKIKNIEFGLELDLVVPNFHMINIFKEIKKTKKVIFTSDMY
ncbi:MAG: glycosyltransferase, partial [Liquorilactobacillus sp.]